MKRNRGRVWFLLLWLIPLGVEASSAYRWSAEASMHRMALHEAVRLTYVCRFDSEALEYLITFDPPRETDSYRLLLESAAEHNPGGKRVDTYRFILFPKKAGALHLAFSAAMGHTSRASIENTVIGRDNVEKLEYTTRNVALPTLDLEVIDHTNRYAGQLTLDVDVDKNMTNAFAPVQVRVAVEGHGNMDTIPPYRLMIPGVRIFGDAPTKNIRLGDNGYAGSIVQRFALVSDRNFTVPPFKLTYFDTETNRTVALQSALVKVRVRPAAEAGEVQQPSHDETVKTDGGTEWLHIFIALIAGIVIGRFLLPVRISEEERSLPEKLKSCNDPVKFAAYLAILDASRYAKMIDAIEQEHALGTVNLVKYKRRLGL